MNLSNDKKRREYVNNLENWEVIGDILGLVQLRKLTYGKTEWLAVCVRQSCDKYNPNKHQFEHTIYWHITNIYQIDTTDRVLDTGWSPSQVVDSIKAIHKEERHK